jgi:hypothetical protein
LARKRSFTVRPPLCICEGWKARGQKRGTENTGEQVLFRVEVSRLGLGYSATNQGSNSSSSSSSSSGSKSSGSSSRSRSSRSSSRSSRSTRRSNSRVGFM